jgi:hypothetical protein
VAVAAVQAGLAALREQLMGAMVALECHPLLLVHQLLTLAVVAAHRKVQPLEPQLVVVAQDELMQAQHQLMELQILAVVVVGGAAQVLLAVQA